MFHVLLIEEADSTAKRSEDTMFRANRLEFAREPIRLSRREIVTVSCVLAGLAVYLTALMLVIA